MGYASLRGDNDLKPSDARAWDWGQVLFKYAVLLLQRGAAAAMEAFAEPQLEKAPAADFCRMPAFFPRFQAFFLLKAF